jgi:hypothetical protein
VNAAPTAAAAAAAGTVTSGLLPPRGMAPVHCQVPRLIVSVRDSLSFLPCLVRPSAQPLLRLCTTD